MSNPQSSIWTPRPEHLDLSNIARLIKLADCKDYDEYYKFSILQPEKYWRLINDYCGVVWSHPYDKYMDDSRGPEFTRWFPGGELNWVDTVFRWAYDTRTANQQAIIAVRESGVQASLSYAQLYERTRRLAAGLRRLGIRKGERVGLLMENGIEANISWLALSYMGAIVVPLFSGFASDAIQSRLASCGARAIISTTGFCRRGRFVSTRNATLDACRQTPDIDTIIWKRSPEGPDLEPGDHSWHELADTPDDGAPSERMVSSSPFMVIYTSGTTGKPKGPVHSHGNFPIKVIHDAAIHFDINPGDVFCWPADMGWIAGPLISGCVLMRGATMVTYDGAPDYPDWGRMASLVANHKVTHLGAAPTLIRELATHQSLALAHDISSIRLLVTAGENIDPEHFSWFQRTFGRGTCPVINYTGGTEVSGGLLSSVLVKPIAPAAFNTASPGIDADVVNENGEPLIGEVGELIIRRPFVGMADCFWNDNERYLDTYWSTFPGMWRHGDLAIRHADHSFQLRGRSDDTMKIAGKRLGPAEVEEVILKLPQISEAAAVGVDDPVKGQKLIVLIIPKPDQNLSHDELDALVSRQVAEQLGKPFTPSRVYCVKELPKTRSSKVMRRVIRNVYTGTSPGDLSSLGNPSAIQELANVFDGTVAP